MVTSGQHSTATSHSSTFRVSLSDNAKEGYHYQRIRSPFATKNVVLHTQIFHCQCQQKQIKHHHDVKQSFADYSVKLKRTFQQTILRHPLSGIKLVTVVTSATNDMNSCTPSPLYHFPKQSRALIATSLVVQFLEWHI